jgi:hypothetical protein
MIKLPNKHPVKQWINFLSTNTQIETSTQEGLEVLIEALNSPFNLITDQKIKSRLISILNKIPNETDLEKLLRAYVYLMIGNVSRSDLYLQGIFQKSPATFFQGYRPWNSVFQRLTEQHLKKVLEKLSRHPSHRINFYLLTVYLHLYSNNPELLNILGGLDIDLHKQLELAHVRRLAPDLIEAKRLSEMSDNRRFNEIREGKYEGSYLANWVWPFMDHETQGSGELTKLFNQFEKDNYLWLLYLLDDEKMTDHYLKTEKVSVTKRRQNVREKLRDPTQFMMALFKLIEMGDLGDDVVASTLDFLTTHE